MCLFDGFLVAVSQRLPRLGHYHRSCHDCSAITEVTTTAVLSWRPPGRSTIAALRPPQPRCYHIVHPTAAHSQRQPNHGAFIEAAQPRHFHGGCSDCGTIMEAVTFMEVATNTTLSWRMLRMWLYASAAVNAMLSQRLHECGAMPMAAATAALSW
jgi:hypothetical protein